MTDDDDSESDNDDPSSDEQPDDDSDDSEEEEHPDMKPQLVRSVSVQQREKYDQMIVDLVSDDDDIEKLEVLEQRVRRMVALKKSKEIFNVEDETIDSTQYTLTHDFAYAVRMAVWNMATKGSHVIKRRELLHVSCQ
jgi:hypothetical protein